MARAMRRYRDKAQGSAGRAEVSTGSCCRRSLALLVVLRILGEVRAGTGADQCSPISPARASRDPPGAGRGCAPSPAHSPRSFPAGYLDLASEEFATTRSPPTLHPIAWPGRFWRKLRAFLLLLFVSSPLRGKRNVYLKLKGMADGARGQSPSSARPHLPARRY